MVWQVHDEYRKSSTIFTATTKNLSWILLVHLTVLKSNNANVLDMWYFLFFYFYFL